MNAVYWGLTALCIMKHKDALDAEETIEYVISCWDDEAGAHYKSYKSPTLPPARPRVRGTNPLKPFFQKGAFGAHPGHDAHILSTLSAIQVLATHDALSRANTPRIVDCTSPHPIPVLQMMRRVLCYNSYPGPTTTLGRLRRRRLWRDGHAFPLLRRICFIPPRRARSPRSRAHCRLPCLMPQL